MGRLFSAFLKDEARSESKPGGGSVLGIALDLLLNLAGIDLDMTCGANDGPRSR